MQRPGTSAAEGKSTSDSPELFRQADLCAEYNLALGANLTQPELHVWRGLPVSQSGFLFSLLQWIKAFDPFYPLAVIP